MVPEHHGDALARCQKPRGFPEYCRLRNNGNHHIPSITTKRTAHGDLSRGSFPCARPLALAAMPDTMDVDGKAPPDGKVSRASQTCARIPSGGILQRGCA